MTWQTVAEASGYLGAALGVAMVVPQIVRTYRNRTMRGVSAMSWSLTALSCLTWLLYGVRADEPPQIPGNVLLVTGAVVVVLAVPSDATVRRRAFGLALGAGALTSLAFVVPPAVVGSIGFAIGVVSGLPQLIVSLRRRSTDSAVSLLAWGLRVACQAAWLFYAALTGDVVVVVSASFLLTNAALVLICEVMARRGHVPESSLVVTAETVVEPSVHKGPAMARGVSDPPTDTHGHRRRDASLEDVAGSRGTLPNGNHTYAMRPL